MSTIKSAIERTIEMPRACAVALSLAVLIGAAGIATAQDKGTLNPKPLPPLAHPDDPKTPAKQLFGRRVTPVPLSVLVAVPAHAAATPAQAKAKATVTATPSPVAAAAARMLGKPSLASANSTPLE